jgi:hypothetical protein
MRVLAALMDGDGTVACEPKGGTSWRGPDPTQLRTGSAKLRGGRPFPGPPPVGAAMERGPNQSGGRFTPRNGEGATLASP